MAYYSILPSWRCRFDSCYSLYLIKHQIIRLINNQKKRKMKQVFSIFAISAMLVACGGQTSQTSDEVTVDSTAVEVVDSTSVETPTTEVEALEEAPAVAE